MQDIENNEDCKVIRYTIKQDKLNNIFKIVTLSVFSVTFLVCSIILGVMYTNSNLSKNSYAQSLESSYDKAVFEATDNINNIELNLNKVKVSSSAVLQSKYLRLTSDECKYAQGNLSILPITLGDVTNAVKFINQLDGYCTFLADSETELSSENKKTISELLDIISQFKISFNKLSSDLINGYKILDGSQNSNLEINDFTSYFSSLTSDSIAYPSMIFDGPFSDSLYNKQIKGLSENEVTKDEAYEKLKDFIASNYNEEGEINYIGEVNANFNAYNFEIKLQNNKVLMAQITKRDGFLISLIGEGQMSDEEQISFETCQTNALNALESLSISNMSVVWSSKMYGIATFNIAPKIDNVIFYPDLIKVKVDMTTGMVSSIDAQNYAYNHIERDSISASLGAVEARSLIAEDVNINTQKLCIMPLEFGGEVLAYEFYCEYYGKEYYIYINANTGKEERVMMVVSTEEGEKLS